jgi:lipopolysaccharide transport system permease protein
LVKEPHIPEPTSSTEDDHWDIVITPRKSVFDLKLDEVWRYRDLMLLFVRRDFVKVYKQTILGPLWFLIQPLLTSVMFTVVFSNFAGIPTDGIPPMLFYLAGITPWNYFAECLKKTSNTFVEHKELFGKVYFPRVVMPLSIVITNLITFGIQLGLFLAFYAYFLLRGAPIEPNGFILLFPLLVLLLAMMGLGFGLLITSMTTRYRDLTFLVQFGVQLAMYATPVIYPLSEVPADYQWIVQLNPMAPIIETFKYGFLGQGTFSWAWLGYAGLFAFGILLLGTAVFNRTEKFFMDTV